MSGDVVTFYSYKGGVGRSFLLANVAVVLSRWGFRVLCIDWDLDAPGLSYYFRAGLPGPPSTGLVNLVADWTHGDRPRPDRYVTRVVLPELEGQLDLLPAGPQAGAYIAVAQSLNWSALYEERDLGGFLEDCRAEWTERYDFVLIDSRTGITDIGAVCTAQLPDVLVMLFTANEQSLEGTIDVADRVQKARGALPYDRARLSIVPIPSRFDESEEYVQAEEWKTRFERRLGRYYSGWLHERMPVGKMLSATTVPYVPTWTFGERLAVTTERDPSPRQISYSLETIAALLAHRLSRTDLLGVGRDTYIAAAAREAQRRSRHAPYDYDVLIDHRHRDAELATELEHALADLGLRVAHGEPLVAPGSSGEFAPLDVIARSRHLVVLVGPGSDRNSFALSEAFFRQTLDDDVRRILIPVYLEGASPSGAPGFFRSLQSLQLRGDVRVTANQIARSIRAVEQDYDWA